ncbi:pyrroline-5-carboxylate reductase [Brachybacterium saurashtrense]|uniref:Pyrroline-5-carboxylate reductase n=1 Tax=Brachybacterium saurashtrense TaxID=556288 RepID=A0A345YPK0_9MICO|nr:pyrroline-5-carboxylate reductase [Brachybacterium saurashtrense]AXK45852.1 pyrroline-5-carboxylate reductase [Brachybacterium saurashtrense]RRR24871.1 pyrroline-5-carboxylate reductase [Brachybacterium saurashtrense]
MNDTATTADSTAASAPDLAAVRVALIGAGNMGGPVGRAMLAAGVRPAHLRIANSTPASSERAAAELGATAAASRAEAVAEADVVVLGVKPYQILDLVAELRDELPAGTLVLSLAAGTTLARIEEALGGDCAAARAMPNTPIAVGEGAVGLMRGSAVTDAQHALLHALFARAGAVVDIIEQQVHAFIGAAGSLPAFVFTLIEAMTDEAVRLGLKRDLAATLVQQTVRGAATMLSESGTHPAVAKNAVSSPGGTTVQGLAALEREGVRAGVAAAMAAAAETSRAMSGD